jgi:hypothetical protein
VSVVRIARQQTTDRNTNDAQTQTQRIATAQAQFPIGGGNLILNQRFVVGKNTYVSHQLQRIPKGYILCNIQADPTQAAATAAAGCQRNTTADPSNNEKFTLSLGPFQPFLADVYCY